MPRRALGTLSLGLLAAAPAAAQQVPEHPPLDLLWVLALVLGVLGASLLGLALWSYGTTYRAYYGVPDVKPTAEPPPEPQELTPWAEARPPPTPPPALQRSNSSGSGASVHPKPPESPDPPEAPGPAAPSGPPDWGQTRVLGQGQYTRAVLGSLNGCDVVLKSFLDTSPEHAAAVDQELEALLDVAHPNVVSILSYATHPLEVLVEYFPQGTFHQFLQTARPSLPAALQMVAGALEGMAYLAEQGIVHRFLAARNCFVVEADGTLTLRIADYGLSREVVRRSQRPEVFEWVRWQPPELLGDEPRPGPPADVYSAGVLLWEVVTGGATPYEDLTAVQAAQAILTGTHLQIPRRCPFPLAAIVRHCWRFDPHERPPMAVLHRDVVDAAQFVPSHTPLLSPSCASYVSQHCTPLTDVTSATLSFDPSAQDTASPHRRSGSIPLQPIATKAAAGFGGFPPLGPGPGLLMPKSHPAPDTAFRGSPVRFSV